MVHPVFTIFINRPEMVVEHVAGYAALVREEAAGYGTEVISRAVAWGVAVLALGAFLILAGVALMLVAMHSQFHWALAAVPGASLALALVASMSSPAVMGVMAAVARLATMGAPPPEDEEASTTTSFSLSIT